MGKASLALVGNQLQNTSALFQHGREGTAGLFCHLPLAKVARFLMDTAPLYVIPEPGVILGAAAEAKQIHDSAIGILGGSNPLVAFVLAEFKFDTKDIQACLRMQEQPFTPHESNQVVLPWCGLNICLTMELE